eukprot:GHVU01096340.1.p2 GENE.GHVU01096340.1~~GHVU01096340.1.p2  ORF type:complete len:104 (-),score=1.89 GHVU01096340.1:321-632(-)
MHKCMHLCMFEYVERLGGRQRRSKNAKRYSRHDEFFNHQTRTILDSRYRFAKVAIIIIIIIYYYYDYCCDFTVLLSILILFLLPETRTLANRFTPILMDSRPC